MNQERRREKEAEQVRASIVEAAAQVIAKRGYHGATMDEIARAAGYSPSAIYNYFPNKGEVFRALITTITRRYDELFEMPAGVSLPFEQRLRWLLSQAFSYSQQNRGLFVTFIAQRACIELDVGSELWDTAHAAYGHRLEQFARLMREGMADGKLREGDPADYAAAFSGLVNAFFFRWVASSDLYPLESHLDTIMDLFFHGVAARDAG